MAESGSILGGLASGIVNAASSAVSTASSVVSSGIKGVTNVASSTIPASSAIASSAISATSSIASSAIGAASSIAQSAIGTVGSVIGSVLGIGGDSQNQAQQTLDSISAIASGQLFDQSGGDTQSVIQNAVSGMCNGVAQQATQQVQAVTSMISTSMSKGMSQLASLKSIIGSSNGATDILQATLNNLTDRIVANMMSGIIDKIEMAHTITHPLFLTIFKETWLYNKKWSPGFGEQKVDETLKSIAEYFDFIQKVMAGAIADIMYNCEDLVESTCDAAQNICNKAMELVKKGQEFKMPDVKLVIPDIPLMSIAKQIEDLQRKLLALKKQVIKKAKQILEKMKSMEAPDLYIKTPNEFFLIMEVFIEAEFIMNNLPIVMDKILDVILNKFVEIFTQQANQIIDQIFSVWQKVIDIVPPLKDLLELAYAIPNTGDYCVNKALNIAKEQICSMVSPYIMLPIQCITQISDACDEASKIAFDSPPKQ